MVHNGAIFMEKHAPTGMIFAPSITSDFLPALAAQRELLNRRPPDGLFPEDRWEFSRIQYMEVLTVPYVWPYELWGYSLKFRPKKRAQKYMVGTCRYFQSIGSWNGH